MALASIYSWDLVAANNSNSDSDLTWAEGQAPSTVNNSARVMMQRVKELLVDTGGSLSAGGTANGLTVTAESAYTAYADGQIISFRATADNTAAATLNVNGIGAKAIRKMDSTGDVALAAGEIQQTGIYVAQYSAALNGAAGAWLLVNPTLLIPDAMPIGMVIDYAGLTEPTKWLFCYGQAISRTTYAALFAVTSTTYGVGNGSTTFNLPDLRGRVVAGQDDMGGVSANRLTGATGGVSGDTLGGTGGAETHTLTAAQMPSHTHVASGTTSSGGSHAHALTPFGTQIGRDAGVGTGSSAFAGGTHDMQGTVTTDTEPAHSHTFSDTTTSAGSGAAHNNVQPTLILNKIIYAGV